jgi:hypothetical protein
MNGAEDIDLSTYLSESPMADKVTDESEKADRDAKASQNFLERKGRFTAFWDPIYERAKQRAAFVFLGEQFPNGEAAQYGLVTPVIDNLLLAYLNQIANEQLQNDFYAKVTPNGGGATAEMARAREQVLRGLQRHGNASQVYNQARRKQLGAGIAYTAVRVDYAGKRGFGKTIIFEDVEDTYNVFPDPAGIGNCTFSSANEWLYLKKVSREDWQTETGEEPDDFWNPGERKEVWQHWVREVKSLRKQYKLSGGGSMTLGEEEEVPQNVVIGRDGQPAYRPVTEYEWVWRKFDKEGKLLDEEVWLGEYAPFIAWTGPKVSKDEKIHFQSMTEFAEYPQKVYTIIDNIIMLRLGSSPYSKWIVADESLSIKQNGDLQQSSQFGGNVVRYKARDASGKELPPPQEVQPYQIDPTLIQFQQVQETKIKQILGIFDAFLGQNENEQSGVALKELNRQGRTSNFHYVFNQNEAIEQMGRVTLDLIPKYLTEPQQMAFVDRDDKAVVRWLNQEEEDGSPGVTFDADEEYQLAIEVGPMAETARMEEAEMLQKMAENPAIGPALARDPRILAAIVAAQPGRYAKEISDFLKAQTQNPEMQQAQQMIGQLQEELKKWQDKTALEVEKEKNRHDEAILTIHADVAKNADAATVAAFNAETQREKVDGMKQTPNSILQPNGAIGAGQ